MRTHYCGDINETLIDQTVTFSGWVHRRRDHGGVIFLDVRDREGMVQVVFDPDTPEAFATADSVRSEYVVQITGRVRARPAGTTNANMKTGMIEVLGKEIGILNKAATPPFPLDGYTDVGEDVRLKYRFMDLRRPEMQEKLRFRSKVTSHVRRYLEANGFWDFETPILTRATPEGARDYLVPSRTHEGSFFALPQSPQLFKQLLMVSGFDRYYQIAKCFRDEDLRADRQPEFTQIDIEASFINEDDIMGIAQGMIKEIFQQELNVDLGDFPRMPYAEAMSRYGSDKPDMRIPMEIVDVAEFLQDIDFKVFSGPAKDPKCRVAALKVPGGAELSRKQIDEYTHFVSIYGAKGLAWIKVNELEKRRGRSAVADHQVHRRRQHAENHGKTGRQKRRHRVLRCGQNQDRLRCTGRTALQGSRRPEHVHQRVGRTVGGGFPDVRRERRWQHYLIAPSVHCADRFTGNHGQRSAERAVPCLRYGSERY